MKHIFLLRHGKSDWDADFERDHDRPLAARGIRDARRVGHFMMKHSLRPDLVLCSSAKRTQQTIELVAPHAGIPTDSIEIREQLYLADPFDVLEQIRHVDPDLSGVLVLGHQPFTGQVASMLTHGRPLEVPTACLIGIEVESFASAGQTPGTLKIHVIPRDLSDPADQT